MNTAIAKSPTQLVKLKSRQEVAEGTMAFHFENQLVSSSSPASSLT